MIRRVASGLDTIWRRRHLVKILFQRPVEFVELVGKDVELFRDRLRHRPAYAAVSWPAAIDRLTHLYPEATSFLAEPALCEIESEVSRRIDQLGEQVPWTPANNPDLTLAHCLYLLCRATRPECVIETGVAYGVTSAYILQALATNQRGKLLSVDLPPLGFEREGFVGILVPETLRSRWELHRGASRRKLPRLLDTRDIDMFVHDSLHTYGTMRWEFDQAWPRLRDEGVLVADDIEGNQAFNQLRLRGVRLWVAVRQETKPRSLFGIAVKAAKSQERVVSLSQA